MIGCEQIETSISFHFLLSKWEVLKKLSCSAEYRNTSYKNELYYQF